ncbi:MAG: hypothetical protein K0B11_08670 [Mariniphaga sp.]|nr:hypothetical protein [Mariniphaga sp.]
MKHLKNQIKLGKSIIFNTVFVLFTLVSCSSSQNESRETPLIPVLPQNQEQNSPTSPETPVTTTTETTIQPTTGQNTQEVMLNPPHGEPFHRCDIPVGAPLNSQPANTTGQTTSNPPTASTPVTTNTAPRATNNPTAPTLENAMRMNPSQARSTTATPSGTKPQLNPPHGQPWHRCDIAVGSPLP